jgi:hypothetical protein
MPRATGAEAISDFTLLVFLRSGALEYLTWLGRRQLSSSRYASSPRVWAPRNRMLHRIPATTAGVRQPHGRRRRRRLPVGRDGSTASVHRWIPPSHRTSAASSAAIRRPKVAGRGEPMSPLAQSVDSCLAPSRELCTPRTLTTSAVARVARRVQTSTGPFLRFCMVLAGRCLAVQSPGSGRPTGREARSGPRRLADELRGEALLNSSRHLRDQ